MKRNTKLEIENADKKSQDKIIRIGNIIHFEYKMDVSAKKETNKGLKSGVQTTVMSGSFNIMLFLK